MASFIKPDGTTIQMGKTVPIVLPPPPQDEKVIRGHIMEIRHIKNFLSAQDEVDIVIKVIVPILPDGTSLKYDPRSLNTGPVKIIQ